MTRSGYNTMTNARWSSCARLRLIRQRTFLAHRPLAMTQPQHGNVTGAPSTVVFGVELGGGALTALLPALPQRTDRVQLRGLLQMHRLVGHRRQQAVQRGRVIAASGELGGVEPLIE